MRYRDATAFRQALEERLKTRAHGDGAQLARDRKRVVFNRLLARLLAVAEGRWLLKGGFALELRLAGRARATKDVDIDWQADEEQLLETLIDAVDYFAFVVERAGAPEDRLGGSHRFRVTASLAGRLFESFLLDVGFRGDEPLAADTLTTEALLAFAEIPPVEVRAVPIELQVATILPAPPQGWALPYSRLAQEVGVPVDLATGHAEASVFLAPILSDETTSGTWNPAHQHWLHDGPKS